ncbi:MAG: M48 family metallopeptidase [Alphaproteobacteria bacterium]|nr:M48 family metallopeptidase [Alphaproteobacteria bacterium]
MAKFFSVLAIITLAVLALSSPAAAEAGPSSAPTTTVDSHALPPIGAPTAFDAKKATDAYLARVSGKAKENSDAYFEGGYVLILVDAIYAIVVAGLLLWFKGSARMRDIAAGMTRSRFWQVPIYFALFFTAITVLSLPLTIYEGFFREQAYGLMNQTFGAWSLDQLKQFLIGLVVGILIISVVYAVIRRARQSWWLWASGVLIVFSAIGIMIGPVFIAPLFNTYKPLPESQIRHDILSLARSEGIPADNVYLFDASRQSDRISANVSGFMGTTRISLNDNLLNKSTHDETLAVLGHEMGHYVLDHAVWGLILRGLVTLAMLAFANWGFALLTGLFGGNWDVRTIDDPAGMPVLLILFTVFQLVATPVNNWITRTAEIQADMFGLNAARKPDAFSTVVLKLANYRKLDPSPWEEAIFYDHPSGRTRIWESMRWKAEHLNDPDIKAGPASPQ